MNYFPSKQLVYSSFLFLYPCLFYLYSSIKQTTTHSTIEEYFFILILFQFILSISFWLPNRPILWVQRIDAFLDKLNVFLFSMYVFYIKSLSFSNRCLYLILGIITGYSFYKSNEFSNQQWLSDLHIYWHFCVHCFGTLAIFILFV
jgi:hypothetical protein